MTCPRCNGDGFTAEHAAPETHPDGTCTACPIQEPCAACRGTGQMNCAEYPTEPSDLPL